MQSRDDKGRIEEAEDRPEDDTVGSADPRVNHCRNHGADAPADRAEHEVRRHHGEEQAHKGRHNHGHHLRRDPFKEALQIDQRKGSENRRDDLRLIADHIDLDEAKIPFRNIRRRSPRDSVGVEELSRDQGETEDQTQDLRPPHLFHHRPADSHRDADMEDGLTEQPEEAVHSRPELALRYQGRPVKDIQAVDHISKAQNQTADDDRRDDRGKDLRDGGHDSLKRILVSLRRALYLALRDTGDA